MRRLHVTIESGHPCCDGISFSVTRRGRIHLVLPRLWQGAGRHVVFLLAMLAALSVLVVVPDPGVPGLLWAAVVTLGVGVSWATARLGHVVGGLGFVAFTGLLVWHAGVFGWPLQIPEALLLAGMFTVVQMVNRRGSELIVGVGFAALAFIGVFTSGSVSDVSSVPLALAFVTTFSITAWTVAASIRRSRQVHERYAHLVASAPIAMVEVDFSGLGRLVEELRHQHAPTLCEHILSDRRVIDEVFARTRVSMTNTAARQLLDVDGVPRHEVMDLLRRQNPMLVMLMQQLLVCVWQGGQAFESEMTLVDRSGSPRHVLVAASVADASSRDLRHSMLSVVDLSRQKALENDLQARLAERDRFVASISHELRTPLTSVIGLGQSLLEPGALAATETEEIIRIMVKEGRDLAHIIEDLLVGARLDLGPLDIVTQEVVVADEVEGLLASLEITVSEMQVDPDLVLSGNRVRFRQILRNMLTNAVKYGGDTVRVVSGWAGDVGYVDVRDNGDPISEAHRARMFEPYERLHTQRGTTDSVGLGLTVSRSLAKAMGGELEYAHDGVEGIFRVSLPLAANRMLQGVGRG